MGPRPPRLTVASGVPTIRDYRSSWLNGKKLVKRRQAKIWRIIAHSLNNFIQSELPAWKSDMGVKEIGKRKRTWQKLRTMLYESLIPDINKQKYDQTKTSNPNIQKYDLDALILIIHRIILFNPGMVSEFYLWWCEQVSVRIIYFLQILQCTLTRYIESHQDLHMPSLPNSKAKRQTSTAPNGYGKQNKHPKLKFIDFYNHLCMF